jgi:hypothetical protein
MWIYYHHHNHHHNYHHNHHRHRRRHRNGLFIMTEVFEDSICISRPQLNEKWRIITLKVEWRLWEIKCAEKDSSTIGMHTLSRIIFVWKRMKSWYHISHYFLRSLESIYNKEFRKGINYPFLPDYAQCENKVRFLYGVSRGRVWKIYNHVSN